MTPKVRWLLSLVLVATATALITKRLTSQQPARPAAVAADDDDSPAARARERRRAEEERRYYDQLDALARAGGGGAMAGRLQRTIDEARTRRNQPVAVEVTRLECGHALCRVELPAQRLRPQAAMAIAMVLGPGMGGLTMRPAAVGEPAVYYVAAPDQELPRLPR